MAPMSKISRSAAMRIAVSSSTLTRSGPRIGRRRELSARGGDVVPEACGVRRRQAWQKRPSMRQLAGRYPGRHHGSDEGDRDDHS